jgi:hypothetical protein
VGLDAIAVTRRTAMLEVTSTSSPTVDLASAKAMQQVAWSAGDCAVVGTTLQIVGEMLCEAIDLRAGERVLDGHDG